MCGFSLLLHKDDGRVAERRQIESSTRLLQHRGPDDEGYWVEGPVAMGFRRLSILDLSEAGHQPMESACGRYVLVFNGEIYNFIELREELAALGQSFRTQTDSEVILAAFRTWGADCFERFNGMWALAIWDRRDRKLTVSRDRFGIKPLYVVDLEDRWLFSSEVASLRPLLDHRPELDLAVTTDFLRYGLADHGTHCFLRGISRFPVAHSGEYSTGRSGQSPRDHRWSYYALDEQIDHARRSRILEDGSGKEEEALISDFRAAFLDGVGIRMRSDVPLGTCLSGGLDSGSIVCATAQLAAAERQQQCRHAFTALFPQFDEHAYIEAAVEQTGVQWKRSSIDTGFVDNEIEGFFRVQDEPVHSLTAFASYCVFKMARDDGVTVLLNGQGADEILAGYDSYKTGLLQSLARERGLVSAWSECRRETQTVTEALRLFTGSHIRERLQALPQKLNFGLRAIQARKSLIASPALEDDSDLFFFSSASVIRGLDAALESSVRYTPLPLYLREEDRNSMAHSNEARLPFLDPRVVRLALTAPADMKRRSGFNKYLLREAARGILPEISRTRKDKMGFPVPNEKWIAGPLRQRFLDMTSEARLTQRGFYDVPRVLRTRDQFLDSPTSIPPELLRIYLFESWASFHYDAS